MRAMPEVPIGHGVAHFVDQDRHEDHANPYRQADAVAARGAEKNRRQPEHGMNAHGDSGQLEPHIVRRVSRLS